MHMVKGGTSEWPDAGFPGIRINPAVPDAADRQ